jgi:hypothetical protein
LKNQSGTVHDDSRAAEADVQHDSSQPVSSRHVVSKNLMAWMTVKSRPTRANDEAVPAAAPRKKSVVSDDRGHSGLPQLEASLARVIAPLSDDNHIAISNALKDYNRLFKRNLIIFMRISKRSRKHSARSRKAS